MDLAHSVAPEKAASLPFGDHLGSLIGSGAPDPFRRFWNKGFYGLLPVVPPAAKIRDAGKRPGLCGPDGWSGRSAASFEATPDLIAEWAAMGAGVGLRCHDGIIGVDFDTTSPRWSTWVHETALRILGPAKRRIGRAPKGLLPYRTTELLTYRQCRFDDDMDPKKPGLVELLAGDTKWFVVDGIHPATGAPYRWPDGIPDAADLTVVKPAQINEFFAALEAELPRWRGANSSSVDRASVDQAGLVGKPDRIRRAMEALPNTPDLFGYHDWLRIAVALRAALPHDEALGLELFEDWTEKGEIAEPSENAARVFWSVDPPFAVGADYLEDLAVKHSGGAFTNADRYFVEIGDKDPLFPETEPEPASPSTYGVVTIDELFCRPDPRFMLERHIPEASLGFLYGDPGTGKSFIALDWALHIAFGLTDWHGDPIRIPEDASVIYIAAEGASGFKTRVRAWMKAHGIDDGRRGRFGLIFENPNFMQREDIVRLGATLRAQSVGRPVLLVVDTVSRAMPGADENLQKEMTLFVAACQALQREFGATVLGVHHANASGTMRGSSVLKGAGDFVFKLERKSGAAIGTLRCEKQKDAPDGWSDPYDLKTVFVDSGQSSLVPFRCEAPSASGLSPDVASRVLDAIEAAWTNRAPWSASYRSKERYAVTRMCRDFAFAPDAAKNLLSHWLGTGALEEIEFSKKTHSKGLRVVERPQNDTGEADNMSETGDESVFD